MTYLALCILDLLVVVKNKFNHRVIYLSIFLIFIPFILITDLYPIMRLGMFAQPVAKDQSIKIYYLKGIRESSLSDQSVKLHETDTGIPEHILNYLIRNHIARNEEGELIRKLRLNPLLSGYYHIEVWERSITNQQVEVDHILTSKIVE